MAVMPNKRSQPVDSSESSSPGRRLASKRPRLELPAWSGKSKNNSALRSGIASGDPLHKTGTLEDNGVLSPCGGFLSGVFATRILFSVSGLVVCFQLCFGDHCTTVPLVPGLSTLVLIFPTNSNTATSPG